jgi:DNA-binding transcriptional LysR family regulator
VWLLREVGSGTRTTTEELFEKFSISPPTLTLGSNGAIRESVQLGLGVTLISRDAVALELERKALTEWSGRGLPLQRQWHVVARSTGELPATTALFLSHVATSGEDESPGRFHLMGEGRTRLRS